MSLPRVYYLLINSAVEKQFKPGEAEIKIYAEWEKSGLFTPIVSSTQKPYTIIMPPPNAYDQLHIGHTLFVTIEDVLIRYHRMKGEPTLWLPGADHAGIASQVFFEKVLKEEKHLSRFDLGKEKFVEELRKFVLEKREIMENQLRRLGASCDWTRKKFTLDPDVSEAVVYTFKKMYDEGLIYRGEKIINWCPRCATGLSDLEVEHKEKEGKLTYIKYPVVGENAFVVVATTRPETMLGDTAIAVNLADVRYKKLIGKLVEVPLTGRQVPIVADEAVDLEFGTGAVKVTPAHDPIDFEIGQRHQLPKMVIIGEDGKMTDVAGKYAGLRVADARTKVVDDLRALSLIEKEEDYLHNIGHCERCKSVVEPLLSKQWFVKIEPLAKAAIEAVRTGKIRFVPKRFERIYFNWMENIRDWNISRQLWWGHGVPVYYAASDAHKFIVAGSEAEAEELLGEKVVKDPDTLDTWFSSGMWPFTTLGWPKETADFKYFYPTTVMETGWDIIFFWVARMIMLGIYCTGKVPFETVYLSGLVRDKAGQKISKSKGNVINPIEMIDKYGTDALRLGLLMGTAAGNDTSVSEEKIRGYRNFANKIWNAARFVQMTAGDELSINKIKLSQEDAVMISEFDKITKAITKDLEKLNLARAGETLYEYFWHNFCDICIEKLKAKLQDVATEQSAKATLHYLLKNSLILLHPFVPFVSEAVWQELYPKSGLLLGQKWIGLE